MEAMRYVVYILPMEPIRNGELLETAKAKILNNCCLSIIFICHVKLMCMSNIRRHVQSLFWSQESIASCRM